MKRDILMLLDKKISLGLGYAKKQVLKSIEMNRVKKKGRRREGCKATYKELWKASGDHVEDYRSRNGRTW